MKYQELFLVIKRKRCYVYSQSCMDGQKTSKIGDNIMDETCPKTEYLKSGEAKNAVLTPKGAI